jgi:hypothetical protein
VSVASSVVLHCLWQEILACIRESLVQAQDEHAADIEFSRHCCCVQMLEGTCIMQKSEGRKQ